LFAPVPGHVLEWRTRWTHDLVNIFYISY
jgi:hypothetical protein